MTKARRTALFEVAVVFLRLGVTAFGGPAAHVAMMEEEVVRRRKWLTTEEFLDLLGATNLIPGPNSTEMAIHIGRKRAGWAGLVVAGTCFIVPASLITLLIAWGYVRYGKIPQAGGVLYGIKPVIIAVVVQAIWGLARTAARTKPLALIGIAAVVAVAFGAEELIVLLSGGAIAALFLPKRVEVATIAKKAEKEESSANIAVAVASATGASSAVAATSWSIFVVFAKIGSVLFGSGYVLLAFLRADLVEHRHWMTEAQLVDAVAVGQLTPGPVFTTATFVGYLLNGYGGAVAATVGIFLPAFVFVALSGLLIPKLRASRRAGAFLDGVNVTSLALMAVVAVQLGRASLVDPVTIALAVVSAALLVKWKVSSVYLIGAGAILGTIAWQLR